MQRSWLRVQRSIQPIRALDGQPASASSSAKGATTAVDSERRMTSVCVESAPRASEDARECGA
jgi:hypothetical protein